MITTKPLKYHGGKTYLAEKIVALMPPHWRYVETHFGGGAVLFAKPYEGIAEFANDISYSLTNFWRVLKGDADFNRFCRLVESTPLSQIEFEAASYACAGRATFPSVHDAADFFIRNRQSRQSLGKSYCTPSSRTRRGMNENVSAWLSAVDGLPGVHARLRRVEIRCQDACELIKELDSPDTLFYCDPPYLHETRSKSATKCYGHEMSADQHISLLYELDKIKGKFMLSGYRSALYDGFADASKWARVDFEIDNKASGAKTKEKKTECVWMNFEPAVAEVE